MIAKHLPMATSPLCFDWSGVDVLQSKFSRSKISIAVFCLQNLICLLVIFAGQIFMDPTFFGIFVCNPLCSMFVLYFTIAVFVFIYAYKLVWHVFLILLSRGGGGYFREFWIGVCGEGS